MLLRKFVLAPLAEIAPNLLHPIEKKRIQVCLENCSDKSDIEKTSLVLKRPISISEKYNYIANYNLEVMGEQKQVLTHQIVNAEFYLVQLSTEQIALPPDNYLVDYKNFHITNFICMPKRECNVHIKAGDPLLHVIPFLNKDITASVGPATDEMIDKTTNLIPGDDKQ